MFYKFCMNIDFAADLLIVFSVIILGMGLANGRRRYIVTLASSGLDPNQNDPCVFYCSG